MRSTPGETGLPGVLLRRSDLPVPSGYAVFDCETTGVRPGEDEIVSLAVVLLDANGIETERFSSLVRPSRRIPAEASRVHGIRDADVLDAPAFADIAEWLLGLLGDRVFAAHNVSFDLAMLQHAFENIGVTYKPAIACTLDSFRVLEPLAENHQLEEICRRHGLVLENAHDALSDALATANLLRILLERDLAPESVRLDFNAFHRLRTRGDTRRASEPQIRRVFGLARAAGLVGPDGRADRDAVCGLVYSVAGIQHPDLLTREQVQDVYDELERLIERRRLDANAA